MKNLDQVLNHPELLLLLLAPIFCILMAAEYLTDKKARQSSTKFRLRCCRGGVYFCLAAIRIR